MTDKSKTERHAADESVYSSISKYTICNHATILNIIMTTVIHIDTGLDNLPALIIGWSWREKQAALMKGDMKPSLTSCFFRNASLCVFLISITLLQSVEQIYYYIDYTVNLTLT